MEEGISTGTGTGGVILGGSLGLMRASAKEVPGRRSAMWGAGGLALGGSIRKSERCVSLTAVAPFGVRASGGS